MASIILNVAGTAIAGPIGGAIGSLVGAAIDAQIAASLAPAQRIESRRLEDLRVTASSEGAVIPRVYGRMRVGGTIIWATDFREETRVTAQGGGKGLGGGGAKVTEYLYRASFAVALCEGEIAGLGRIWADAKPFDLPEAVYRVQRGGETQAPDPLIESLMGAGETRPIAAPPMSSSRICRWKNSATACRRSPSRCSGRSRTTRIRPRRCCAPSP
ncbi:MAG TPA: hypothetical protein VFR34_08275 [Paracoccaceae bacterium]|nr:hypothetical protein [Paracoccaceae bacterium]